MHILVVNDDGPPSNLSSPYVHSLVTTLQAAGHIVSVVLPHTQRSWIGKAHMVGQTVKPSYFRPGTLHEDDGTVHSRPSKDPNQEEWVLVDGTPASCVQIGLYHFFKDRGPIDLVVSGPNYDRNTTAVFALSSGTLGGALEAAVCRKKAVAISYAFTTRNHEPANIASASRLSVRLVEYLVKNWDEGTDVYSINVPLVEKVEEKKVLWTKMLQNYWEPSSCFDEIEDEEDSAEEEEERIREQEGVGRETGNEKAGQPTNHTHKHFKWAPRFADVYKSVDESEPGNDGWAVREGFTSVTPLKANFMHAGPATEGELKLSPPSPLLSTSTTTTALAKSMQDLSMASQSPFTNALRIYCAYGDDYVQPLILRALQKHLPNGSYELITQERPPARPVTPPHFARKYGSATQMGTPSPDAPENPDKPTLYIFQYESIPFDTIIEFPSKTLCNSYIIRKALIRKHYLANTVHLWTTKHPESILATHVPTTVDFECDYAAFLGDAFAASDMGWYLEERLERNEKLIQANKGDEKEWWILKPSMMDRGQGIRLFSTLDELAAIFESWEYLCPDSSSEESADPPDYYADPKRDEMGDEPVTISQTRHFVAQPYIANPLLLDPWATQSGYALDENRGHKFHLRVYVLVTGDPIRVYVYRNILALFAGKPYKPPRSEDLDFGTPFDFEARYAKRKADERAARRAALGLDLETKDTGDMEEEEDDDYDDDDDGDDDDDDIEEADETEAQDTTEHEEETEAEVADKPQTTAIDTTTTAQSMEGITSAETDNESPPTDTDTATATATPANNNNTPNPPPDDNPLAAHLTNTCFQQGPSIPDEYVQEFFSLPRPSSHMATPDWHARILRQILRTSGDVFEGAARESRIHFQAIPNAFEVFGLDFLVDEELKTWLLEVNSFPDFRQTGSRLDWVVGGLWEGVVRKAVLPWVEGMLLGRAGGALDEVVDDGGGDWDLSAEEGEVMILARKVYLGSR